MRILCSGCRYSSQHQASSITCYVSSLVASLAEGLFASLFTRLVASFEAVLLFLGLLLGVGFVHYRSKSPTHATHLALYRDAPQYGSACWRLTTSGQLWPDVTTVRV